MSTAASSMSGEPFDRSAVLTPAAYSRFSIAGTSGKGLERAVEGHQPHPQRRIVESEHLQRKIERVARHLRNRDIAAACSATAR